MSSGACDLASWGVQTQWEYESETWNSQAADNMLKCILQGPPKRNYDFMVARTVSCSWRLEKIQKETDRILPYQHWSSSKTQPLDEDNLWTAVSPPPKSRLSLSCPWVSVVCSFLILAIASCGWDTYQVLRLLYWADLEKGLSRWRSASHSTSLCEQRVSKELTNPSASKQALSAQQCSKDFCKLLLVKRIGSKASCVCPKHPWLSIEAGNSLKGYLRRLAASSRALLRPTLIRWVNSAIGRPHTHHPGSGLASNYNCSNCDMAGWGWCLNEKNWCLKNLTNDVTIWFSNGILV